MNNQKGQALLLAIVAIAAVLVVSLSVVSRSVTDVRTTANQEDSVRAFSAAESGVERALLSGSSGTITASDLENASYTASVSNFGQGLTEIIHPRKPLSGDDVTIWMMSHDANGNLVCPTCYDGQEMEICWGTVGSDTAVQVSVLYDPGPQYSGASAYSDISIARTGFDPNPQRRSTNNFLQPASGTCSIGTTTFAHHAVIDFDDMGIANFSDDQALKFVKIRPLYNINQAYPIGVKARGSVFPGQGKQVESTGTSGDATRKIRVYTLYPDLPFVFDSTVFSLGGIQQ